MACVAKGLSRQDAHEEIRKFSLPLIRSQSNPIQVSSPTKLPTTSRSRVRTTTSSSVSGALPSSTPSSPSSRPSSTPAPSLAVLPSRLRSSPLPRWLPPSSPTPLLLRRVRLLLCTFKHGSRPQIQIYDKKKGNEYRGSYVYCRNEKLNSLGHVTFLAPLPYFPDAPRTSVA